MYWQSQFRIPSDTLSASCAKRSAGKNSPDSLLSAQIGFCCNVFSHRQPLSGKIPDPLVAGAGSLCRR